MPVYRILRKDLSFRSIQKSGSDFLLIFENPSHFSAIFPLKKVKISLRNFRISLRNFEITLSNPKISLLDFCGGKFFAEIPQFYVLFCQKSRVKTFYFFVKILYLSDKAACKAGKISVQGNKKAVPMTRVVMGTAVCMGKILGISVPKSYRCVLGCLRALP